MTDHERILISANLANNFYYTMKAKLDQIDALVSLKFRPL